MIIEVASMPTTSYEQSIQTSIAIESKEFESAIDDDILALLAKQLHQMMRSHSTLRHISTLINTMSHGSRIYIRPALGILGRRLESKKRSGFTSYSH